MVQVVHELVELVLWFDALAVDFVVAVRSPLLTKVMNSVTGLGSAAAGIVFLGLFYLADWEREFELTLVSLTLSAIIVATLMGTVQRPFPPHPVCLTGSGETIAHSFPSGHAAAVTVYAMVASRSNILPTLITTVFAVTVAFSRVYLGTHFLSDTVAGVVIGIGTVLLAERIVASDRVFLFD
ncbi:phosphatase PAP2 family protein [Halodesulfurarchaeum sp. HSR-GB]|uniref:phosphatase PAP2 family protein n=1 Tax=Halodesulfurarchaeum sp. HSR-GB TaxID=3074077 RepID=UPI00285ED7A9|nr:phosphatase PAP2 family protein [Halodesulfurarchaeum sp. HSR-GB]MDR5657409.1 phosphatase PAP2 family protein [Halodesulfurarchaeum sp. HSR-GB]